MALPQDSDPRGTTADVLVERLTGDRFNGYLRREIPSHTDDDVRAAVEAYIHGDPDGRTTLLDLISEEPASVIEIFGERQAVVAVRTGSLEPIRRGLVAVGIAFPQGDYRETLMGLSKLDHSALLLDADLADLFDDVSALLPESARNFIADYLTKADRGPSFIKSMGYGAYGSGADFVYDNASPYDDE